MGILQILQLVLLAIKFTPVVIKLALNIYETVEEYARMIKAAKKTPEGVDSPTDGTSEDKRRRFDLLLKVKSKSLEPPKILSDGEINEIREGVWKYKNRKRKAGKTRWA